MACNAGHFSCEFFEKHVIDASRQELYPHNERHSLRELLLHIWYPQQKTNSMTIAPAKKVYPLIIFSHGLGGAFNGLSYTALCEYCACQGYVVVSVSHTYACKSIMLSSAQMSGYLFPVLAVHCRNGDLFDIELETWVSDIRFVLDQCMRYNNMQESVLYQKIDSSKIGVIGHSFGGATAVQVCRRDDRVKAAINLDGPLYGVHATVPFSKPVLFIVGQFEGPGLSSVESQPLMQALLWAWHMKNNLLPDIDEFIQRSTADVYKVMISGIVHATFSDETFVDSVMQPWLSDGAQAQTIIQTGVVAFFDQYLQN
jgi:dienelactone hydrolase